VRLSFVLANALRESRGARARLFQLTLCLAVGVAAVVGVAGVIGGIEDGIRVQSRAILSADLAVEGRRPLPPELERAFEHEPLVERTDVIDLGTMARRADAASPSSGESAGSGATSSEESAWRTEGNAPRADHADATASREPGPARGRSQLVELRVASGRYPLYGELALEPDRPLAELVAGNGAVVAPELCSALGVAVGDELSIGGARFQIRGTVTREPDRLGFSIALGPRVFVSSEGFERTELQGFGSRIRYRALFAFARDTSSAELAAHVERLRRELPGAEYLRIETHDRAQPDVRRAVDRVGSWLGLVALLSLVLGGSGVAQIVRAWTAQRTSEIAVLRCLGFTAREILASTIASVALLSLAGSLLGALAGSVLVMLAPALAPSTFPADLVRVWQPAAIARGMLLGMSIATFFSLLPLSAVWRVSPARVLRSDVEPLPASRRVRILAIAALCAAVFASAWLQSGSAVRAAWFGAGLAALSALLFGAPRLLVRVAAAVPRGRLGPSLRHGVAALARPGAGTIGATVALGLGVMVIATLLLVERRLADELSRSLPLGAPSAFLVDIQPDQWVGIRGVLADRGATSIDSVPVLTARLAAIDGRPVEELSAEGGDDGPRRRWVLTREQRLTWLDELPPDNVVVDSVKAPADGASDGEGATRAHPWIDPLRAEISLEREFARDLGVGVGSTLRFDVQGVDVDLAVTSLRTVEWRSFGINFFLVAEPGALEAAPHSRIASARLPPEAEVPVQDELAERFPNVTLLRIRSILDKIADVMSRLSLGVHLLGSLTIVTGLAIQAGVVAATAAQRGREVALLKTLGLTRRGVVAQLAVEHALVGFVAGAIGGSAAIALSVVFLERVVELPSAPVWSAVPLAALGSALLAAVSGVLASSRALAVRPIESLRG
jgi:putative ABC transport system permease protein